MATQVGPKAMAEANRSEEDLQRRWAESRWPTPFLSTADGERVRVITPGRWNRGPGPDFIGAQILDGDGRARRGNVELHLDPRDWLQHGHEDDRAYDGLLLHLVERRAGHGRSADSRIPTTTGLPAAVDESTARLACEDIVERAGAAAVEAQLLQIARRRFERKIRELESIAAPNGPGSEVDRRCLIAAARALGQPHNASLSERAMRRAIAGAAHWSAVDAAFAPAIDSAGQTEWRRGRGALGTSSGLDLILRTLRRRWTDAGRTPAQAFSRLASVEAGQAAAELQISGQLGRGRALQLLADAVYPLAHAWTRWLQLPAVRYRRTDELRARLRPGDRDSASGLRWRHPHSQALLELERTRCRQWACRICPLAALAARQPG